ncbi:hypothetical protein M422DRAFT_27104 [Sphaerobolus stellatus SS14]|nr:hypothetical protein M422DRAFT_27104 [Sphaerobolus stellatus SS14]
MAVLTSILGGSGFGLLVRLWQLGIQKRPLSQNLPAHISYMAGFGFLGYWADVWEVRSNHLIAQRKETIRQNRVKEMELQERMLAASQEA